MKLKEQKLVTKQQSVKDEEEALNRRKNQLDDREKKLRVQEKNVEAQKQQAAQPQLALEMSDLEARRKNEESDDNKQRLRALSKRLIELSAQTKAEYTQFLEQQLQKQGDDHDRVLRKQIEESKRHQAEIERLQQNMKQTTQEINDMIDSVTPVQPLAPSYSVGTQFLMVGVVVVSFFMGLKLVAQAS